MGMKGIRYWIPVVIFPIPKLTKVIVSGRAHYAVTDTALPSL